LFKIDVRWDVPRITFRFSGKQNLSSSLTSSHELSVFPNDSSWTPLVIYSLDLSSSVNNLLTSSIPLRNFSESNKIVTANEFVEHYWDRPLEFTMIGSRHQVLSRVWRQKALLNIVKFFSSLLFLKGFFLSQYLSK
jgi:hypothetical protein